MQATHYNSVGAPPYTTSAPATTSYDAAYTNEQYHRQQLQQQQQQQQQVETQHSIYEMQQPQHAYVAGGSASTMANAPMTSAYRDHSLPVMGTVEQTDGYSGSYSNDAGAAGAAGASGEAIARWSWSLYPGGRADAARMVVPLGCMYTPLGAPCAVLSHAPVVCSKCGGVLNPYTQLDVRARVWVCVLCRASNALSLEHAQRLQQQQQQVHQYTLTEALPGNETVEYVAPILAQPHASTTFALVMDTCIDTLEELTGMKEFVTLTLDKLPEYAAVCVITFGATVQIHEVVHSSDVVPARALVLRGTQDVQVDTLRPMLDGIARHVAPLHACRATVQRIIDQLTEDMWPVEKGHRPLRCTGAALATAASLLQLAAPNTGSCVLAFLSGVCTTGPGMVVDTDREHIIRGHADIRDGTAAATHWAAACDFYDALMKRIVSHGHALSCFTASLDQLGVAEMKLCIQASGGVVLNAESWLQQPFRVSLDHLFARRDDGALQLGFNATMEVMTSPTWKVQGVIGQCVGTGKRSPSVADYEIGIGGTCEWTTCMLDNKTTFAIYYDTAAGATAASSASRQTLRYTQIITRYELGHERRTRVTTLAHAQRDSPSTQELVAAFDQETAAVLLARQAVHKTDNTPLFDVLRWLDRTLVRLVSRFGEYEANVPSSLRLPQTFVLLPAFIYHLRRSGYLQVFNSSPDESAIIRLQLLKSNVTDSIVQIQPTLYSYRLDATPQPVALDSTAIQPDNVLLLDTFFEVLVHYGSVIAAWKRAGYAEQDDYAYLREFLAVPMADAQTLVANRYPVPRLIEVSQDDPDARILYNRINPSRSYTQQQDGVGGGAYGTSEGELVYTDDASLQLFMNHLKRLAVAQ